MFRGEQRRRPTTVLIVCYFAAACSVLDAFIVAPSMPSKPTFRLREKEGKTELLIDSLRDAAVEVGNDLFVAFRWGAANALTSALPQEQKKELLDRLDPEDPNRKKNGTTEEDEMMMQHSVNEAVAAALAAESQKEKKRYVGKQKATTRVSYYQLCPGGIERKKQFLHKRKRRQNKE